MLLPDTFARRLSSEIDTAGVGKSVGSTQSAAAVFL
jgi:hypothetical protein